MHDFYWWVLKNSSRFIVREIVFIAFIDVVFFLSHLVIELYSRFFFFHVNICKLKFFWWFLMYLNNRNILIIILSCKFYWVIELSEKDSLILLTSILFLLLVKNCWRNILKSITWHIDKYVLFVNYRTSIWIYATDIV